MELVPVVALRFELQSSLQAAANILYTKVVYDAGTRKLCSWPGDCAGMRIAACCQLPLHTNTSPVSLCHKHVSNFMLHIANTDWSNTMLLNEAMSYRKVVCRLNRL